jgi:hypothetical protein
MSRLNLSEDVAGAAYAQVIESGFGFQRDAKLDMQGFDNMLATRAQTEGRNPKLDDKLKYIDESWYRRAMLELTTK